MRRLIPHSRPTLGPAEARAAAEVVRSGQVARGPHTKAFERAAADYLGLRHAAAVSSGTKALELALRALGVKQGDEVLIPTYSCSALWHAARRTGASPILVDCEDGGDNADMRDAARRRTRKTRAMIAVHLFGMPADLAGARALGVPLVEDCAGAIGGRWNGKPLGTVGAACALSFYATKLATTGEGGMVLSSDRRLIARARDLGDYDEKPADRDRDNAKISDIQSAVGRVQLGRLDGFLAARARLAAIYDEAFRGLDALIPPRDPDRVYFRYVLRVSARRRDSVISRLRRAGVSARLPVFRPLHLDAGGRFPNADRAWRQSVSLPLYPTLTQSEQERVIAAVAAALAGRP